MILYSEATGISENDTNLPLYTVDIHNKKNVKIMYDSFNTGCHHRRSQKLLEAGKYILVCEDIEIHLNGA